MGRPRKQQQRNLMVATETFMTRDRGNIIAGQTIVWDDDELVTRFPHAFQVSDAHRRPEVEQATSAPGELRG